MRTVSLAALLVFAAAAPCRAQAGWERVDVALPPPALAVDEAGGSTLVARGDAVVRVRDGVATALECTVPEGTGAIAALCGSPAGLVFAAAANGLFVAHADVATLDRVDLQDGAPRGPPLGVASDRLDRVWLATATEVGCVHQGFWFGRTHGAGDGVPPPPYRGLALGADGRVLLAAASGVFAYRPDPTAPILRRAELAHELASPGAAELRLDADAAGGATFRWRAPNHHLPRDLSSGRVVLQRPGTETLLVQAFDRDLDASTPRAVAVRVPYPEALDPRLLLAVAAAFAVVLWLSFARRARRIGASPWRAVLETAIVLILLAQVCANFAGVGRTYPVMAFTMYREVWREGDVLFTPRILVTPASGGAPREWTGGAHGFTTQGVWRHLAEWLYADAGERLRLRAALPADDAAIELRVLRCRLTRNGPREVAPWVLARIALPEVVR